MIPRSIIHEVTYGISTPITTSRAVNNGVRKAAVRNCLTCCISFLINVVYSFSLPTTKVHKMFDIVLFLNVFYEKSLQR